jgi:hypothetical protein
MLSVREGAARVQPQASGAPVDEHEAAGILLAWFRKFYAGLLEQLLDKFDSDGKPKPNAAEELLTWPRESRSYRALLEELQGLAPDLFTDGNGLELICYLALQALPQHSRVYANVFLEGDRHDNMELRLIHRVMEVEASKTRAPGQAAAAQRLNQSHDTEAMIARDVHETGALVAQDVQMNLSGSESEHSIAPSEHSNAPSEHRNPPSEHSNAPSEHSNAPSEHSNAPSERSNDTSARHGRSVTFGDAQLQQHQQNTPQDFVDEKDEVAQSPVNNTHCHMTARIPILLAPA